jgi:hypothetical protein
MQLLALKRRREEASLSTAERLELETQIEAMEQLMGLD